MRNCFCMGLGGKNSLPHGRNARKFRAIPHLLSCQCTGQTAFYCNSDKGVLYCFAEIYICVQLSFVKMVKKVTIKKQLYFIQKGFLSLVKYATFPIFRFSITTPKPCKRLMKFCLFTGLNPSSIQKALYSLYRSLITSYLFGLL